MSQSIQLKFGLFSVKKRFIKRNLIYTTYYVLAHRGKYLTINPYAISDQLIRIISFLKAVNRNSNNINIWLLSFNPRYLNLLRWCSWSCRSYAYSKLTREESIIIYNEQMLMVEGYLSTYAFVNFLGIDICYILSSDRLSHRSGLITDRAVATIGLSDIDNENYLYSLPGVESSRSILLNSRLFSILISIII